VLLLFDTICASSFDTKCVNRRMETTQNMVMDSCALHFNATRGDDCISTPHMVVFLVIVRTTLGEIRANQFGLP
jgi:hypothetical protein